MLYGGWAGIGGGNNKMLEDKHTHSTQCPGTAGFAHREQKRGRTGATTSTPAALHSSCSNLSTRVSTETQGRIRKVAQLLKHSGPTTPAHSYERTRRTAARRGGTQPLAVRAWVALLCTPNHAPYCNDACRSAIASSRSSQLYASTAAQKARPKMAAV